jgi:hypothetical protein
VIPHQGAPELSGYLAGVEGWCQVWTVVGYMHPTRSHEGPRESKGARGRLGNRNPSGLERERQVGLPHVRSGVPTAPTAEDRSSCTTGPRRGLGGTLQRRSAGEAPGAAQLRDGPRCVAHEPNIELPACYHHRAVLVDFQCPHRYARRSSICSHGADVCELKGRRCAPTQLPRLGGALRHFARTASQFPRDRSS